jgi:hypothetical protein
MRLDGQALSLSPTDLGFVSGCGDRSDIGYVDAHLLASAALGNVRLWTRDRRLRSVAEEMGLA